MALTDNILAYWKLDNNGSGGVSLVDSTGNGNALTNNNGVTLGTGIIGGCGSFNGTDQYASATISNIATGYESVSFSFWLKSTDSNNGIFAHLTPTTLVGGEMLIVQIFNSLLYANNGAGGVDGPDISSIFDGGWHHFVVVLNAGDLTIKVYIDNVINYDYVTSTTDFQANSVLYIGSGSPDTQETYGLLNGSIDEFGLWNRALSPTEVTKLYNGGSGLSWPFPAGLYFNAAVNGNLATLGNWWQDSGFTIPADALPDNSNFVFITAPVTSGTATYGSATITANIGSAVSITANYITINSGINSGTLIGPVVLNNSSSNAGTITGNATLRDSSTNSGTITGNANVYYDNGDGTKPIGGIVGGDITYIDWPITKAWFSSFASGTNDEDFANPANWWLDAGLTIQANIVPSVVADIVVVGAMSAISTGTAVVNSVAVLNGGFINSIEVTAINGVFIIGGSSSGSTFYTSGGTIGESKGFISRLLKLPWFINI
jgi:hypothetical protein